MDCCGQLVDAIKGILKQLAPIIAIALICFAAYMLIFGGEGLLLLLEGFEWLPAVLAETAFEAETWAYLALGAAVIISPETVTDIAVGAAQGVGSIAGAVIGAAAGATANALFGMSWTQVGLLALGGYLLFGLLTKEDKEKALEREVQKRSSGGDPLMVGGLSNGE